jgi:hypothetical protein
VIIIVILDKLQVPVFASQHLRGILKGDTVPLEVQLGLPGIPLKAPMEPHESFP